MTKREWEAMPRRKQLVVLRHMQASTVKAMPFNYDQMERVLRGLFMAEACSAKDRCSACRAGWTSNSPAAPKENT